MNIPSHLPRLMRQVARACGQDRQLLADNLALTLRHESLHQMWILSLSKRGELPDQREEDTCRAAFAVPDGASRTALVTHGWGVIRYEWVEKPVQGVLLDTRPLDGLDYYGVEK